MNGPNLISLSRLASAGLLTWLLSRSDGPSAVAAVLVFLAGVMSDWVDGAWARRRGLVTPLGMLLDPLADKVLVGAALVCVVEARLPGADRSLVPAWAAVTILAREFLVMGLRVLGGRQGIDLPAGWWGKHKTAAQMLFLLGLLGVRAWLLAGPAASDEVRMGVVSRMATAVGRQVAAVVAVLTGVSGVVYFRRHWPLLAGTAGAVSD